MLRARPAVNSYAALDRDRHVDRADHRPGAVRHQIGRLHEGRAEAAGAHPRARAADVEIDLVVAEGLADFRRPGQRVRLRAAELEAERMLRLVEGEQPGAVAVHHRVRRHHLAVEERARGDLPQEVAAVPVGPRHHGRDAQPAIEPLHVSPVRFPVPPRGRFRPKRATAPARATACRPAGIEAKASSRRRRSR